MRILQICNKPPFPPVDGGAIAMHNTTMGLLERGHSVKVLSMATPKHGVKVNELPETYKSQTNFEAVFIDTSIKVKDAFLNLFSSQSYNIQRFVCKEFEKKLVEVLKSQEFDVVLIESLFVTPYVEAIKSNSKAKIVLRAHNVEHKIWERFSQNSSNLIKRKYLELLAKRLKEYEVQVLSDVDAICTLTKVDQQSFKSLGFKKLSTAIPIGYKLNDADILASTQQEEKQSLFHIASMDWMPNIEGVDWLLDKVWPKVVKKNSKAKLYLAGRNMPERYYTKKTNGVTVVGEVPEAKQFYISKKIMLVPVLSGSGMRIKIIEGMALGKVIISTTIGAEGIACQHNKNILIADTPHEFAAAIDKCLNDNELCARIGENAKNLINEQYNNDMISEKFTSFLNNVSLA
jgi:glycosyltransferase involved in cell wall biosynthesis